MPALGIEHSAEEERYRDLPKEEEEHATTITDNSSIGQTCTRSILTFDDSDNIIYLDSTSTDLYTSICERTDVTVSLGLSRALGRTDVQSLLSVRKTLVLLSASGLRDCLR